MEIRTNQYNFNNLDKDKEKENKVAVEMENLKSETRMAVTEKNAIQDKNKEIKEEIKINQVEDIKTQKKKSCCSQTTKGVLTLIGGFCVHLVNGTLYSFGLLNPFFISYLHIFDDKLLLDDGFFLMPLGVLFKTLFLIVGGVLEAKAGPKIATSIGVTVIILSYIFLYFSKTIAINYLSLCLFGCGVGLNYLSPIRTIWKYFPKNKGLCVGIIIAGGGLSATFLNFVLMAVINPEKQKPDKTTKMYSPEIANNVKKFILIALIANIVLSIIGILLIHPYVDENVKTQEEVEREREFDEQNFELQHVEDYEIDGKELILIVESFCFFIQNSAPTEMKPKKIIENEDKKYILNSNEIEFDWSRRIRSNNYNLEKAKEGSLNISAEKSKNKKKRTLSNASDIQNKSYSKSNFRKIGSSIKGFMDQKSIKLLKKLSNKETNQISNLNEEQIHLIALSHNKYRKATQVHSLHLAIFSWLTLKYMIIMYCGLYLPSCLMNMIKPFSLYHTETLNENLVFWMSVSYSIINGLGRTVWGVLYDNFGFRKLLLVAFFLQILVGAGVYFVPKISGLFFICPILAGCVMGAVMSVIPASITKVYGLDNSSEIYGFVYMTYGISAFTSPILSKLLKLGASPDDSPFLIIFEIGAGLAVIGFILTTTMDEAEFDYDKLHNEAIPDDENQHHKQAV